MSSSLKNLSDFSHTEVPPANNYRFGIVVAEFNRDVTSKVEEGALAFLKEKVIKGKSVDLVHVPGAFELPLTALTLAESGDMYSLRNSI